MKLRKRVAKFAREECGVTTTEYAVLLAVIVIVAMKGIASTGVSAREVFNFTAEILGEGGVPTP